MLPLSSDTNYNILRQLAYLYLTLTHSKYKVKIIYVFKYLVNVTIANNIASNVSYLMVTFALVDLISIVLFCTFCRTVQCRRMSPREDLPRLTGPAPPPPPAVELLLFSSISSIRERFHSLLKIFLSRCTRKVHHYARDG